MAEPRINLIKDMVPTVEQRKRQYVFFVSYLLLCGLVTILIANTSAKLLLDAYQQKRIVWQLEHIHEQSHPESPGMVPFADDAVRRLQQMSGQMALIEKVTDHHAFPATIMYSLIHELPGGAYISSLSLNQSDRKLQFELNVPSSPGEAAADPHEYISLWNSRPELNRIIENLTATHSERMRIKRQHYYVTKFTGTIRKIGR